MLCILLTHRSILFYDVLCLLYTRTLTYACPRWVHRPRPFTIYTVLLPSGIPSLDHLGYPLGKPYLYLILACSNIHLGYPLVRALLVPASTFKHIGCSGFALACASHSATDNTIRRSVQ